MFYFSFLTIKILVNPNVLRCKFSQLCINLAQSFLCLSNSSVSSQILFFLLRFSVITMFHIWLDRLTYRLFMNSHYLPYTFVCISSFILLRCPNNFSCFCSILPSIGSNPSSSSLRTLSLLTIPLTPLKYFISIVYILLFSSFASI